MRGKEYTLEEIYRVWNDDTGESVEIDDDSDGLGLAEIRQKTDDGKIANRIRLPKAMLEKLIDGACKYLKKQ